MLICYRSFLTIAICREQFIKFWEKISYQNHASNFNLYSPRTWGNSSEEVSLNLSMKKVHQLATLVQCVKIVKNNESVKMTPFKDFKQYYGLFRCLLESPNLHHESETNIFFRLFDCLFLCVSLQDKSLVTSHLVIT